MGNNNEKVLDFVLGEMKIIDISIPILDGNNWPLRLERIIWGLKMLKEELYIIPNKSQKFIVKVKPNFIDYLYKPSAECLEVYFKQTRELPIEHINGAPLELLKKAVLAHPDYIRHISWPSEELQKISLQRNMSGFKFIKNPTENIQRYAINEQPHLIRYIEHPSEEIQMLAIEKDYKIFDLLREVAENAITTTVREFAKEQFIKQTLRSCTE